MNIQWYPGHMTKAIRLIEENVKLVDAVLYILDARAPFSSLNPDFQSIVSRKPVLLLLNKTDLADKNLTRQWIKHFESQGFAAKDINGTDRSAAKVITASLKTMLSEKVERYLQRGANIPLRAMIIGIPNCGKSTILNSVAGVKRAETGDRPGVTKGRQWLRLESGIELLDTPGTLWNAFPDQRIGQHLAYIGSINDDILDTSELALNLLSELSQICPKEIAERYKIDLTLPPLKQFEQLCIKRGFLIRGGEPDLERGANALIDDFRKCRIKPITLEKPGEYGK